LHFDNGLTTAISVADREMEAMLKHLRGEPSVVKVLTTDGGQIVFNRHKLTAAVFSPEPVRPTRKSRARLALKPADPVVKKPATEPQPEGRPQIESFEFPLFDGPATETTWEDNV